jgi:hypothetical protein
MDRIRRAHVDVADLEERPGIRRDGSEKSQAYQPNEENSHRG